MVICGSCFKDLLPPTFGTDETFAALIDIATF
jgi:hypothetical protein